MFHGKFPDDFLRVLSPSIARLKTSPVLCDPEEKVGFRATMEMPEYPRGADPLNQGEIHISIPFGRSFL